MDRRRSLTILSGAAIRGIAGRGKARVVEAQERSPSETQGETSPEKLLLKDYRPKSIYRIPETRITKAKYPVIDCHTHPYARGSNQVDQWAKNMDAVGLEKSVILTMASGDSFNEIRKQFSPHPDRFELWCGFDFAQFGSAGFEENAVEALERCHRN